MLGGHVVLTPAATPSGRRSADGDSWRGYHSGRRWDLEGRETSGTRIGSLKTQTGSSKGPISEGLSRQSRRASGVRTAERAARAVTWSRRARRHPGDAAPSPATRRHRRRRGAIAGRVATSGNIRHRTSPHVTAAQPLLRSLRKERLSLSPTPRSYLSATRIVRIVASETPPRLIVSLHGCWRSTLEAVRG